MADQLTTAQCENLVIPAYFYPGAEWTRVDHDRPVPKIVIMDPAGPGAGNLPDPKYQKAVRQAQAAGITILGYADTSYSMRPVSAVEADVRNYKAWYRVTSIFLDQVASSSEQLPYYRKLASYIHGANPGSAVMLNPGTYPAQQYMSVGDILVVFENTYASYANLPVPAWTRRYPAARFAHIVYATSGPRLTDALALAARRHAGYVYVTDGSGSQRYGSLPGYWGREKAITARCATGKRGAGQLGSS
ncbi:MAG: spherulation-specific family 4 protein [Actinobacteria bacterium]|nr:spherulation-specific family 4 protein [Actinomycetota bacterium]